MLLPSASLITFAFVSSITPGPNNLMLLASGMNFGFRRTLPHMIGIGVGFMIMIVLMGLGLTHLFDIFPVSYTVMQVLAVLYLLYLAYKIATAAPPEGAPPRAAKPFTFLQAALFQWVNPKAWVMALSAITLYCPTRDGAAVFMVALAFGVVNVPCVGLWALLGDQLRRYLKSPTALRVFNYTMAFLLVASLAMLLK